MLCFTPTQSQSQKLPSLGVSQAGRLLSRLRSVPLLLRKLPTPGVSQAGRLLSWLRSVAFGGCLASAAYSQPGASCVISHKKPRPSAGHGLCCNWPSSEDLP